MSAAIPNNATTFPNNISYGLFVNEPVLPSPPMLLSQLNNRKEAKMYFWRLKDAILRNQLEHQRKSLSCKEDITRVFTFESCSPGKPSKFLSLDASDKKAAAAFNSYLIDKKLQDRLSLSKNSRLTSKQYWTLYEKEVYMFTNAYFDQLEALTPFPTNGKQNTKEKGKHVNEELPKTQEWKVLEDDVEDIEDIEVGPLLIKEIMKHNTALSYNAREDLCFKVCSFLCNNPSPYWFSQLITFGLLNISFDTHKMFVPSVPQNPYYKLAWLPYFYPELPISVVLTIVLSLSILNSEFIAGTPQILEGAEEEEKKGDKKEEKEEEKAERKGDDDGNSDAYQELMVCYFCGKHTHHTMKCRYVDSRLERNREFFKHVDICGTRRSPLEYFGKVLLVEPETLQVGYYESFIAVLSRYTAFDGLKYPPLVLPIKCSPAFRLAYPLVRQSLAKSVNPVYGLDDSEYFLDLQTNPN